MNVIVVQRKKVPRRIADFQIYYLVDGRWAEGDIVTGSRKDISLQEHSRHRRGTVKIREVA